MAHTTLTRVTWGPRYEGRLRRFECSKTFGAHHKHGAGPGESTMVAAAGLKSHSSSCSRTDGKVIAGWSGRGEAEEGGERKARWERREGALERKNEGGGGGGRD